MSSSSAVNTLLSSSSASSASSINISSLLAAATGATSVGIDVTSAVDAAVYAARAPERQWQTQQTTIQSQIVALNSIETSLSSVSADLSKLNDLRGSLVARTVSSSNASSVVATAASGAKTGSHIVSVNSLATSASAYSPSLASSSSPLGSSTLTITNASGAVPFTLGPNGLNSLDALATSINASSLGITANVVSDANGSRLALVSGTSGTISGFTVADAGIPATTWTSGTVAASSTPLSASTIQVGDGSASTTISVAAGTSLAALASQINGAGLNLTASVGTNSSGAYLSITGASGNTVSVSSDPTLSFVQPSQGTDASLVIDGIPVTSATNVITGVVPGLTLNLLGTTSGSGLTLQIQPDSTQISSAVSQFVKDYNTAASLVNGQFTYSTSTSSQGVLGSSETARSIQSMLLGIGSYSTTDASTSSAVRNLGGLGITMNSDGTLNLDTATLDRAASANPTGVQNFFQGTALNGFASVLQNQLDTFNAPSTGALALDISSLTQQYSSLQTDINNFETNYITPRTTILTTMYSNAEIALQRLPTQLKQLQAELGGNSSGN